MGLAIDCISARRGAVLVVLLCGGDKRSQRRDIAKAKRLVAELEIEA
jgi:putative addiction module killer protein